MSETAQEQVDAGNRFAFGDNWRQFLALVDDGRVRAAEAALVEKLGDISGMRMVDVGSGSGLMSLAARNLGAQVVSFDFDPQSVSCTRELCQRYRPEDADWRITQGSVLDDSFIESLGQFEVVYAWGVLHHTGDMWSSLANVDTLVAAGGRLFLAIYNDQGRSSRTWKRVKRTFNGSSRTKRRAIHLAAKIYFGARTASNTALRVARGVPPVRVPRERGMDKDRDLLDWIGGWPFEVAKPEQIFEFYRKRGFTLESLGTCGGGLGCNEFVFERAGKHQ